MERYSYSVTTHTALLNLCKNHHWFTKASFNDVHKLFDLNGWRKASLETIAHFIFRHSNFKLDLYDEILSKLKEVSNEYHNNAE